MVEVSGLMCGGRDPIMGIANNRSLVFGIASTCRPHAAEAPSPAAAGIGDFRYILGWTEHNAPLRRAVATQEAGDKAVDLLSDMSRGITAEVLHVDAGHSVVGMKHSAASDLDITIPKK